MIIVKKAILDKLPFFVFIYVNKKKEEKCI